MPPPPDSNALATGAKALQIKLDKHAKVQAAPRPFIMDLSNMIGPCVGRGKAPDQDEARGFASENRRATRRGAYVSEFGNKGLGNGTLPDLAPLVCEGVYIKSSWGEYGRI